MNLCVCLMLTIVYESCQYTSSKNHIIFWNYSFIIRYTSQLQYFGSIGHQISRFVESPKKISYLWNITQLFLKKEFENTININKNTKHKTFTNKIITISIFIIGFLHIINIAYFEKLFKRKQHLLLLNEVGKFLKNSKIYLIVPLLWLNDNEAIYNVGFGCENESMNQGRSYINKNINITNCFFSRYVSYSGNGGAIYVNGGSYSMNVNYSIFYNCVCSNNGGAIYFSSSNSDLRMICANRCSCGADYSGHFAYLIAFQVNQVEYLSVSNCSHTTSGYNSIRLDSGNQRVDNTNCSLNNAEYGSGILIYYPSSSISSHCTFSNNKVTNSRCIFFYSDTGSISMSYANIVHNNSPFQYGVVLVEGVALKNMIYCIFQNNQNYLFCVFDGSLEVSHSFISHSASFSTSTSVSKSNNNSFTIRNTYQLQFFNSIHCNADIPLIELKQMITFDQTYIKSFALVIPMIILMIS